MLSYAPSALDFIFRGFCKANGKMKNELVLPASTVGLSTWGNVTAMHGRSNLAVTMIAHEGALCDL